MRHLVVVHAASIDADTRFRLPRSIGSAMPNSPAAWAICRRRREAGAPGPEAPPGAVAEQERINACGRVPPGTGLKALFTVFAGELAAICGIPPSSPTTAHRDPRGLGHPYIGDLIGHEPLHALGQARGPARAEVAHTIAPRRGNGSPC
jgi:hypothetical protein